jgi:two-component system, sensor histidine kinase and response regulator
MAKSIASFLSSVPSPLPSNIPPWNRQIIDVQPDPHIPDLPDPNLTEPFINVPATLCHIKGNILVIDDTPDNLRLLSAVLLKEGYEVRGALTPSAAFMSIEALVPDLILLDIRMPEMDGYQVCKILKQDDRYSHIPIIFFSACNSIMDKVKAFEVGGVDYITKPFQAMEVLSRINVHLSLRRSQQTLEIFNQKIIELLEKERESSRLRSEFFSMISHDFRTPLSTIQGFASLFKDSIGDLSETQQLYFLDKIERGVDTILEMLDQFFLTNKVDQGKLHPEFLEFDLNLFCASVIEDFQVTSSHSHQLKFSCKKNNCSILSDPKILRTVLDNLMSNAIKYSPMGGEVCLSLETLDDRIYLVIQDQGIGISPENQKHLFESFYRADNTGNIKGTGLGLAIVKKSVEALGGTIQVSSQLGKGTTFILSLPRSPQRPVASP